MPTHELVLHRGNLNGANFNEEHECFAIAYDKGFRVYNSDPMEPWVVRDLDGGIGCVSMLHRTNFLALVGGGNNPKFPKNQVILWDDSKQKAAVTIEFQQPVVSVQLTRTRVVVVLNKSVQLYSLSSPPQKIASFETASNPHGILALSKDQAAFPGSAAGRIQIVDLETGKVQGIIRAHRGPIRALAIHNGVVASASSTGTIVRLWDIETQAQIHEFRRGLDKAEIYSLALNDKSIAVLSDKSTLHVFDITGGANRTHVLKRMPVGKKYFGSEWSFVCCQTQIEGPGVIAWVTDNALILLGIQAGRWEKYVVLRDGKELLREAWRPLI